LVIVGIIILNSLKKVFRFIFSSFGWRILGDVPRDIKKFIIIAAPHTTNWDFIIGLMSRLSLGFKSKFLGKKSLFRKPFGWLFRWLGGVPVDRSQRENVVDQVVKIFNDHEEFVLALAPEGSRKNRGEWKTGFYYIAKGANVPIVRVKIDMRLKSVEFFKPFWTTGSIENDLPVLQEVYQ
jgi:1-acyl-sn-glycerol-3-phosphate acyltransferase